MSVPSYQEVTGEDNSVYTVFVVEILTAVGEQTFLQRRYNAFLTLHKELKKEYPTHPHTHPHTPSEIGSSLASFPFPTKAILGLGQNTHHTKESRREKFDQYVHLVVQLLLQQDGAAKDAAANMPHALAEFLSNTGKVHQVVHKSTLRSIIRTHPRPAESDIKTIHHLMTRPTMFLKYGRRGDPHWRRLELVWLDGDGGAAVR